MTQIQSLARELPYASGAAIKKKKKKTSQVRLSVSREWKRVLFTFKSSELECWMACDTQQKLPEGMTILSKETKSPLNAPWSAHSSKKGTVTQLLYAVYSTVPCRINSGAPLLHMGLIFPDAPQQGSIQGTKSLHPIHIRCAYPHPVSISPAFCHHLFVLVCDNQNLGYAWR